MRICSSVILLFLLVAAESTSAGEVGHKAYCSACGAEWGNCAHSRGGGSGGGGGGSGGSALGQALGQALRDLLDPATYERPLTEAEKQQIARRNSALAANTEGIAADNRGDFQQAVSCYERALNIGGLYNSDIKIIQTNLRNTQVIIINDKGVAEHNRGNYVEAIRIYREALALAGKEARRNIRENTELNLLKAQGALVYQDAEDAYRRGDFAEAIKFYKTALKHFPDSKKDPGSKQWVQTMQERLRIAEVAFDEKRSRDKQAREERTRQARDAEARAKSEENKRKQDEIAAAKNNTRKSDARTGGADFETRTTGSAETRRPVANGNNTSAGDQAVAAKDRGGDVFDGKGVRKTGSLEPIHIDGRIIEIPRKIDMKSLPKAARKEFEKVNKMRDESIEKIEQTPKKIEELEKSKGKRGADIQKVDSQIKQLESERGAAQAYVKFADSEYVRVTKKYDVDTSENEEPASTKEIKP